MSNRPKLNDEQGAQLFCRVAAECCPDRPVWKQGLGVSFSDWLASPASKPRLSFADRYVADQLEQEGAWWIFTDQWVARQQTRTRLRANLDKADARLVGGDDNDHGLAAAMDALDAVIQAAGIGMHRTPALDHLRNALADAKHGIPNPMWKHGNRRSGKPVSGAAKAEFVGNLAGLIQVLADALGPNKLTDARSGVAGLPIRRLAAATAKQLNMDWCDTTAESLHARVVGPLARGGKSPSFDWQRMLKNKVFNRLELGDYPRERSRFLEIIKRGQHAKERGEDMKRWCAAMAKILFSTNRLPRANTE